MGQHHDAAAGLAAQVCAVVENGEVHSDDRVKTCCHAGLEVLYRSVQPVPVGAGKGGGPGGSRRLGELIRPRDPVVGAEGGGNVEMCKAHAVLGRRASWIRSSRQRPLPVCRTKSRVRWSEAAGVFPSGALPSGALASGAFLSGPDSAGTTWTRQISWSTSPWPPPNGARCSSAHHWRRSNQCTGSAQTE